MQKENDAYTKLQQLKENRDADAERLKIIKQQQFALISYRLNEEMSRLNDPLLFFFSSDKAKSYFLIYSLNPIERLSFHYTRFNAKASKKIKVSFSNTNLLIYNNIESRKMHSSFRRFFTSCSAAFSLYVNYIFYI